MKQIQSAGGPLIGLDRIHLPLWSGVFGKNFIDDSLEFKKDYEYAGYMTDGHAFPPCYIAKIIGKSANGVLFTLPDATALLDLDGDAVYIAQIECCEPEWDFHLITEEDFRKAVFNPEDEITFSCQSGQYVIFDSAYRGQSCGDDCLTLNLDKGNYTASCAFYVKNALTELILCKIKKYIDLTVDQKC